MGKKLVDMIRRLGWVQDSAQRAESVFHFVMGRRSTCCR